MLNLFKSDEAGDTNLQFEGHCAMTTADKENEVQQNVVSSLIEIQNSDLCCFTETTVKHVEGNISWEYDEGNMSRGNIY